MLTSSFVFVLSRIEIRYLRFIHLWCKGRIEVLKFRRLLWVAFCQCTRAKVAPKQVVSLVNLFQYICTQCTHINPTEPLIIITQSFVLIEIFYYVLFKLCRNHKLGPQSIKNLETSNIIFEHLGKFFVFNNVLVLLHFVFRWFLMAKLKARLCNDFIW